MERPDDRPEPLAPRPAAWTVGSIATLACVGALLGAMLGASALGVVATHTQRHIAGENQAIVQRRGPRLTTNAVGVWREIRESDEAPTAVEWLAHAIARLDGDANGANGANSRNAGRTRRTSGAQRSGGVTSDSVPAGPAQGYVDGRPTRITVTRLDGKPVEIHTAIAFERMRAAAQRDGVTIRINSGFRTMEHQQALYAAFRRGTGNLAAVPGASNHQSGHALDLNTATAGVLPWLQRNARRFGFRRTVPSEPWHWEYW